MSKKSTFFENLDSESKGYIGEMKVFNRIKDIFSDRECVAKHGYIMNFSGNKFTIEADVLLLDKEFGINIFEVKSIRIDNITSINLDGWYCEGIYSEKINPNYQADRNASNIIEFLKNCKKYSKSIGVKSIIVLPHITSTEWKVKGFEEYAFLPPIIFKDDLKDKKKFLEKLKAIPYKCSAKQLMKYEEFYSIKNILFGEIQKETKIHRIISEDEFLENLLE